MLKILFLGDVVGKPGRKILRAELGKIRQVHSPDIVIVNGENSAGGLGIDPSTADEIFSAGADVITTGNHVWNKKDINPYLDKNSQRIIRPLNYPLGAPGRGVVMSEPKPGVRIGIVNLIGRVFMPDLVDCPFAAIENLLKEELADCPIRFVDFHAEATSEKMAMAHFLDGRATVLVGTHTHVQTADECIMPGGLAYITDAGMCGPRESVIGVDGPMVVERFRSGRPLRFEVAGGPSMINGLLVECDASTGKSKHVQRIFNRYET